MKAPLRQGDIGKGNFRKFVLYECWTCYGLFCAKHADGHAFNAGHQAFRARGNSPVSIIHLRCSIPECEEIIL